MRSMHGLWVVTLVLVALLGSTDVGCASADTDMSRNFVEGLVDTTTIIGDYLSSMIWPLCEFHPNIANRVKERLATTIKGQSEGVDIILNALSGWEFQRELGNQEPLVLSITGPTGVGKSETSYQIAQALFPMRMIDGLKKPCGWLSLRGEDYSNASESFASGIPHMQKLLRQRIAKHIKESNGNAVILFDEIQKVQPGIMEIFLPMLEKRGSLTYIEEVDTMNSVSKTVDYYWNMLQSVTGLGAASFTQSAADYGLSHPRTNNKMDPELIPSTTEEITRTISTTNVIFLFVSDIGLNNMLKLLLKYGDREHIPLNVLRSHVKAELDNQWERLILGKAIKEVVPYLPLEPVHVQEVLELKIRTSSQQGKDKRFWLELKVDDNVQTFLSSKKFVDYERISTKQTEKLVATRGARSLENAGPLQDLFSLIKKRVHSWKESEILHIGMIDSENVDQCKEQWRVDDAVSSNTHLFLQWCLPDPCLFSEFLHGNDSVQHNFDLLSTSDPSNGNSTPEMLSFAATHKKIVSLSHPDQCQLYFQNAEETQRLHQQQLSSGVVTNRANMAKEWLAVAQRIVPEAITAINQQYAFSSMCDTFWIGKF